MLLLPRPSVIRLLLCPAVLGLSTAAAQERTEQAANLEPVVVSATRTQSELADTARSVTVVDAEAIERQAGLDRNLGRILASKVPGLGPSTEAVTNFGQTLRGRNFLVLIDGVPQSTPLRDASRDLNTIAPSSIERIEVVRGGTATYGFGAAGGLINIITKKAAEAPLEGYAQAGLRFSTEHVDDSGTFETEQRISGSRGDWDYLLSGALVERQGQFDADGRRIPPDPLGTQGGFADTTEYSLLGKAGYALTEAQRLQLSLSHLDNRQDSNFTFDDELTDGRTRARPLEEAPDGTRNLVRPGTRNTVADLRYEHGNLAGSRVQINSYFGDQRVVFPKFPGFPQGDIESRKLGTRSTVNTPLPSLPGAPNLVWGADYLRDETVAESINAPNDTPDMTMDAIAGFGELELAIGDIGLLRGGLRHEVIAVDTGTVASNQLGNRVEGGTLRYDETLLNLGGVLYLGPSTELFASFSQGFSIADIGRVIRDAGSPDGGENLDAESFESEAEKVDNYELGLRYRGNGLQTSVAAFYSESDNGATFDDALRIRKFEEDIHGIEGAIDYALDARSRIGGTASWAEGERSTADGSTTDLDGTRIPPLKLTAHIEHTLAGDWENRLQVTHVGSRDKFPDAEGPDSNLDYARGEVERYTVIDLISRLPLGPGRLQVSLKNLLNEDYVPAINQAFNIPTAYASGPGRTLGMSYALRW